MSRKSRNKNHSAEPVLPEAALAAALKLVPRTVPPRSFYVLPVIFAVYCYIVLYFQYGDFLYILGDRSLFLADRYFFYEYASSVGGILQYASRFLMQFFLIPAIGAAVITALLCFIQFTTAHVFQFGGRHLVWSFILPLLLIYHLVNYVYLVYLPFNNDFLVVWMIGPILTLSFAACADKILHPIRRLIFILLGGCTLYYVAGLFGLTAILLCAARIPIKHDNRLFFISAVLLAVMTVFFFPQICYTNQLCAAPRYWIYFIGIPIPAFFECQYSIIYLFFIICIVIFEVVCQIRKKRHAVSNVLPSITILQTVTALLLFTASLLTIYGSHYSAEIVSQKQSLLNFFKACRETDHENWRGILAMFQNDTGTTQQDLQFYLLSKLALCKTGNLGNAYFYCPDTTGDKQREAATRVYYHFGFPNLAIAAAVNENAVCGESISCLKTIASSYLVAGEWRLAKKYLTRLSSSPIYRRWALRRLEYVDRQDKEADQVVHSELIALRSMMPQVPMIGLVQWTEKDVMSSHGDDDIRKATNEVQDVILIYWLAERKLDIFLRLFDIWCELHPNVPIPRHYQEAYLMTGQKKHLQRISPVINSRFMRFRQHQESLEFQGTYWSYWSLRRK